MTKEIVPSDGPVLELGAGTGVFTRALLDRGVRESDLTLVEYGSDFAPMLQFRFPTRACSGWMPRSSPRYDLFPGAPVGAVVSGLPLFSMSPRKIISILSGAFSYVRPTGSLLSVHLWSALPGTAPVLDRLGLKATRVGGAVRNHPPAAVYRITRRQPLDISRRSSGRDEHEA